MGIDIYCRQSLVLLHNSISCLSLVFWNKQFRHFPPLIYWYCNDWRSTMFPLRNGTGIIVPTGKQAQSNAIRSDIERLWFESFSIVRQTSGRVRWGVCGKWLEWGNSVGWVLPFLSTAPWAHLNSLKVFLEREYLRWTYSMSRWWLSIVKVSYDTAQTLTWQWLDLTNLL